MNTGDPQDCPTLLPPLLSYARSYKKFILSVTDENRYQAPKFEDAFGRDWVSICISSLLMERCISKVILLSENL